MGNNYRPQSNNINSRINDSYDPSITMATDASNIGFNQRDKDLLQANHNRNNSANLANQTSRNVKVDSFD